MTTTDVFTQPGFYESAVLQKHSLPLREWQEEALAAWEKNTNIGVIEAVTGSGKSLVGILAAARALDKDMAVVIVVPKKVLQEQWIQELKKYFPEYGIVGGIGGEYGNTYNWRSMIPRAGRIVVAVVNTFASNLDLHPEQNVPTLLIADEVHNYSGKTFRKVLNKNFIWRMGLTATLEPQDGRYWVFSRYFGELPIYTYGFKRALADRSVSRYSVMLIRVDLDQNKLEEYQRWSGYAKYYRSRIIEKSGITFAFDKVHREISELKEQRICLTEINSWEEAMNAADEILAESESKASAVSQVSSLIADRGNTIVFSDSVRLANLTQDVLAESGLRSAIIKAGVPDRQRTLYFSQLKRKQIQALISPRALDEGVNLENLTVGLFVGVRRRRLQLVQRLGRVLRYDETKAHPLVIVPVNRGTWEDPFISGNEYLENSPLGMIVENADQIHALDVTDHEAIRAVVESYMLCGQGSLKVCA
jgi:RNA polymerase primary sigma factor